MAQCSKDAYLKIVCFFSVETENPIKLQNTGIEVDLGIKNFLTISDDRYVLNPRCILAVVK
ncbi:MAG: transposase [Methanosarcinaceae archaeon]|nr:transposase [Methanosarcinaceae archaeon]